MRTAKQIADDLRAAVDQGCRLLDGVAEARTVRRADASGWCVREVIGHLIDSACNNHRRFVINQARDVLSVDPYQQSDWVARQRYADQPAGVLLRLWRAYNNHLATVIEVMPEEVLHRARGPAGELGFDYARSDGDTASLALLAEDYVGHIRHHLRQIEGLLAPDA